MGIVREGLSAREREILCLLAEGAADKQIASRLHLSLNTVKWHNRQIYAKLEAENRTQAVKLAGELGLLEGEGAPERPASRVPHNLPAPVSSFVGREREIAEISELLKTNRLVTLTGPGGVGKTRLALEVAQGALHDRIYPDGIYLIDLGRVADSEKASIFTAQSLDLITKKGNLPEDEISEFLGDKELLLLMDNCEHLADIYQLILLILKSAPQVRIISTSREQLRISGEQVFPVQPLTGDDGVQLLISRAKLASPEYSLSEDDLSVLTELCHHLDGLPLAIELAASRISLISPRRILDQLEVNLGLLSGGPRDLPDRQQSLERAIAWSFNLLDAPERTLFYRLSVFQGSSTIESADVVCCRDLALDPSQGLFSLVSKNLLQVREGLDGEVRFQMLRTIHQYARNRLEDSGETVEVQLLYAKYFAELAEQAMYPHRGGPDQIRWIKRLRSDHDNLRAVLDWSLNDGDISLGMRLAGSLTFFFILATGSLTEIHDWVCLAMERIDEVSPQVQATMFTMAGASYFYSMEFERSRQMYSEALRRHKELGNLREHGWTLALSTNPLEIDDGAVYERLSDAAAIFTELEDHPGLALVYVLLGKQEEFIGKIEKAKDYYEKSMAIAQENRIGMREATPMIELGLIAMEKGRLVDAEKIFKDCIKLDLSLEYLPAYTSTGFIYLAGPAIQAGNYRRGVILLSSARAHTFKGGFVRHPHTTYLYDEYLNTAKAGLAADEYSAAWAAGQGLDFEEAVAFALEEITEDELV